VARGATFGGVAKVGTSGDNQRGGGFGGRGWGWKGLGLIFASRRFVQGREAQKGGRIVGFGGRAGSG